MAKISSIIQYEYEYDENRLPYMVDHPHLLISGIDAQIKVKFIHEIYVNKVKQELESACISIWGLQPPYLENVEPWHWKTLPLTNYIGFRTKADAMAAKLGMTPVYFNIEHKP